MRSTKTMTILFSGVLAILAPSGFAQASTTAQSGTAKLQVTQCALKESGMTCGGCAGMVEKSLLRLDGVNNGQSGLQDGRGTSRIRLKEDHARENCRCLQPGELGFSGGAVEAKSQLAQSLNAAEEEESSCQIVVR